MKLEVEQFDRNKPNNRFQIVLYRYLKDNKLSGRQIDLKFLANWECIKRVLVLDMIADPEYWSKSGVVFRHSWYESCFVDVKDISRLCDIVPRYIDMAIEGEDTNAIFYLLNIAVPILQYHIPKQPPINELAFKCLKILQVLNQIINKEYCCEDFLIIIRNKLTEPIVSYIVNIGLSVPGFFSKLAQCQTHFIAVFLDKMGKNENYDALARAFLNYLSKVNPEKLIDVYANSLMNVSYSNYEPYQTMLLLSPYIMNCYEDADRMPYSVHCAMQYYINFCLTEDIKKFPVSKLLDEMYKWQSKAFLQVLVENLVYMYKENTLDEVLRQLDYRALPGNVFDDIVLGAGNAIRKSNCQCLNIVPLIAKHKIPTNDIYSFDSYSSCHFMLLLACVGAAHGMEKFTQTLQLVLEHINNNKSTPALTEKDVVLFFDMLSDCYIKRYLQDDLSKDAIVAEVADMIDELRGALGRAVVGRAIGSFHNRLKKRLQETSYDKKKDIIQHMIAVLFSRADSE